MRIVIFSPSRVISAIARVTNLEVLELRRLGHEAIVVSTDEHAVPEAERFDGWGRVPHWADTAAVGEALSHADIIMYQIGNNYDFHAGGIHWLERVGGVVCLHDFFLGGLFYNWANRGNERAADRVLQEWYGKSLAWLLDLGARRRLIEESWPAITFAEWIVAKADAIIVHSEFGLARVRSATSVPIRVLSLPYVLSAVVGEQERRSAERLDDLVVLTFGAINPNKAADVVIRAIAADSDLTRRVRYRLAGAIEDITRDQLTALAVRLGVSLTIAGKVSDEQLGREIDAADVVCCIRLPSIESASASAIEAMLSGSATIVADSGFYRDLPDNVVVKINPELPEPGLTAALEMLGSSDKDRTELGKRAKTYAEATFRADKYVAELLALAAHAEGYRAPLEATRSIARSIAKWGGMRDESLLRDSVDVIEFLSFGGGDSRAASDDS